MIINLKIEDRLYETYLTKFGSPKHYTKMKQAIEAFAGVPDHERVLMLYGEPRRELEKLFQTTLDDADKLVRLTRNLDSVKIEGVEMNFDEAEMARIKMQASFHGRTTEQFIKEMITEIKDRMLEKV